MKDKNNKLVPGLNLVRQKVLTEYSGVRTILQVEIVRAACKLLDKGGDGRAFILKDGEDPEGEGVPYLHMIEMPNRYYSTILVKNIPLKKSKYYLKIFSQNWSSEVTKGKIFLCISARIRPF